MKTLRRLAIGLLLLASASATAAVADSVYTIEDPPVDFEVIDAEPFDGIGDNGPFDTFNDALLGTIGEARSTAEFDLSGFSVPPGEQISSAVMRVRITDVDVFGLGVDGETPSSLAVDGYVGNGLAELSDFQAGNGNLIASVDTPDPWVGQVVSFDVTSFITDLVLAHERFAGLTVRAGSFGGLMMEERSGYPSLTIETAGAGAVAALGAEPLLLGANMPNPFTAATWIEYTTPEEGAPVLSVHDVAGRLVATIRTEQAPGVHRVSWEGRSGKGEAVPAGVYFYTLSVNGKSETRRMLLVR